MQLVPYLPQVICLSAVQDVEDQLAELDVQEALGMQAPAGSRARASTMNTWHPVGLEQVWVLGWIGCCTLLQSEMFAFPIAALECYSPS